MKKTIVRVFKDLLNMDVRVINLPEEDIDLAIYVIRDKKMVQMSEKKLAEYSFDFAITRMGDDFKNWIYIAIECVDGIMRNGEVLSPPDCIERESVMTYTDTLSTLKGLVVSITDDYFNDILMCQEEIN